MRVFFIQFTQSKVLKQTFKFFSFLLFCQMLSSCQTQSQEDRALYNEVYETRHGWTIFTGPKRTVVDVNDENSIKRGKTLFLNHCAACHGESGVGDGPKAKRLKLKPANLTRFSKAHSNYYLVFQVNEGKGDMPQWKDALTPRETWDLSNYIQTLRKQ